MKEIETMIISKAKDLLESGAVKRVVGWRKGEFLHDPSPATFETVDSLKDFVYKHEHEIQRVFDAYVFSATMDKCLKSINK